MDKIDLSAFSNHHFDPIDWINNWFDSNEGETKIETIASNLVFNLQLLIQEVNLSLDESARKMMNNLPQVVDDIEMIEKDSIVLKQQLHTNKQHLSSMSSHSLQTITNLDMVKHRMQTLLNTLCSDTIQ